MLAYYSIENNRIMLAPISIILLVQTCMAMHINFGIGRCNAPCGDKFIAFV